MNILGGSKSIPGVFSCKQEKLIQICFSDFLFQVMFQIALRILTMLQIMLQILVQILIRFQILVLFQL